MEWIIHSILLESTKALKIHYQDIYDFITI